MARKNSEKEIKKTISEALGILGVSGVSVEVYLVSDEIMRSLNLAWREKDKPTNVLSFESPKGVPRPDLEFRHLGEIYLAPEYVSAHNEDIRKLAVHGLLHLLGYDHIRSEDAKKMERAENSVFRKMGI